MEQVLVVDRAHFFAGDWPQGFVALAPDERDGWLVRLADAARFADRDAAEIDPSRKQLVPYCVLRHGEAVFCVERLKAHTEDRLHGLLSIGLGGHIEPADGPITAGIVARALRRELDEELILPPRLPEPTFLGLLNDDSNPVGAVHAGLVHELVIPTSVAADEVGIREISKLRGGFRVLAGPSRVWQDPHGFETWSALLLERFSPRTEGSSLSPKQGTPPRHGREETGHGGTECGQAVP